LPVPHGAARLSSTLSAAPAGRRVQQALNIGFQLARIGDVRIAQAKGQLGGFDDAVNGSRRRHRPFQAVGDAEDRQRDQPLRRRGEVPDLPAGAAASAAWCAGRVGVQVGQRDGQAQRLHTLRQTFRQRAAIKAVQTVFRQARQGRGQAGW
jgi:hypothetical protein